MTTSRDPLAAALGDLGVGPHGLDGCGGGLTRRQALTTLGVGVAAALAPRAARAAGTPLRIGVVPSDHYAALYAALDGKTFEAAGFAPDVKVFPGGPPMLEAFVAGQLDVGYVGPPGRIAVSRGLPVRVVTGIAREGSSVISRPEITRLSQLVGKRVAVPVRGTIAHILLLVALDRAKIDPKDVSVIEIRDPGGLRLALERGDVQAVSVWEPWAAQLEFAKAGHMLAEGGKVWPGYQCDSLIVSNAMLAGKKEEVRGVIAAHVKATRFVVDHGPETVTIVAKALKDGVDVEKVALSRNGFTAVLNKDTMAQEFALYQRLGIIKSGDTTAFEKIVDMDSYHYSLDQWRSQGGKV